MTFSIFPIRLIIVRKCLTTHLVPGLMLGVVALATPVSAAESIWQKQVTAFAESQYQAIEHGINNGPRAEPGKNPAILDEQALILGGGGANQCAVPTSIGGAGILARCQAADKPSHFRLESGCLRLFLRGSLRWPDHRQRRDKSFRRSAEPFANNARCVPACPLRESESTGVFGAGAPRPRASWMDRSAIRRMQPSRRFSATSGNRTCSMLCAAGCPLDGGIGVRRCSWSEELASEASPQTQDARRRI